MSTDDNSVHEVPVTITVNDVNEAPMIHRRAYQDEAQRRTSRTTLTTEGVNEAAVGTYGATRTMMLDPGAPM